MSIEKHSNYGLKLKDQQINRAALIGCAAILFTSYLALPVIDEKRKNPKIEEQKEFSTEEISLFTNIERRMKDATTTRELQEIILSTVEEYNKEYGKVTGYEDTVLDILLRRVEKCVEKNISLEETKGAVFEYIVAIEVLENKVPGGDKEEVKRALRLIKDDDE